MEAARRAGYKSPHANASRLMANEGISAYISRRMADLEAQRVASADEVMRFFSSVMRGEVKDQFGMDPSLADRLNAGKELMKRHTAAKNNSGNELSKLDRLLEEVTNAAQR